MKASQSQRFQPFLGKIRRNNFPGFSIRKSRDGFFFYPAPKFPAAPANRIDHAMKYELAIPEVVQQEERAPGPGELIVNGGIAGRLRE